jgi:hypothetical protein
MRRNNAITSGLTLAFILSMIVPDGFSDRLHLGGVPLGAFVFAVLCLVLFGRLLRTRGAITPWFLAGCVALVVTTAWGYFRGNIEIYSLKFFVADVFCFVSLLAGYSIARVQADEGTVRLVSRIAMFTSIVIVATYVGLFAGVLSTAFEIEGRRVTQSIFNAVAPLLICLPAASASARERIATGGWRAWFLFAVAAGTGVLSATRSIVILVVLAAFLYLILKRKQFGAQYLLRLAGGAGALVLALIAGLSVVGTFVFERLNETQLGDESRLEELSLWWPQVSGDVAEGQGMGSRFISNVVVDESPLASAPHIGIASFLMKGGILLFVLCAVLPLCVGLSVLFSRAASESQRGAAGSVVMFVGLACLSGGWAPLPLFSYGLAISLMTSDGRWRQQSSSRGVALVGRESARQYESSAGHR